MAAPLTKRQTQPHIANIQTAKLLKALADHVDNKREMSPTQVKAADVLLKKTIPDLRQTDYQGQVSHVFPGVTIVPPR